MSFVLINVHQRYTPSQYTAKDHIPLKDVVLTYTSYHCKVSGFHDVTSFFYL